MDDDILRVLSEKPVAASAPCRLDLGGTLDIGVFHYPLSYLEPATFNIALNMRTAVRISSYAPGWVRISSAGFSPAEFPMDQMPFDHPMGLIFAIAAYFRIHGIQIEINSSSPPKSALGGSSAAAVAVIAAFNRLLTESGRSGIAFEKIPVLAHAIEQGVAGTACGCQDQMAAAYGGVNAWYWRGIDKKRWFAKKSLLNPEEAGWLNDRMLVAYCGVQHDSGDVNGTWIRDFLDGTCRRQWVEIVGCTKGFIRAFAQKDVSGAVFWMNRETGIRSEMTPHVLDSTGEALTAAARDNHCGARFTGAGGGGCVWAFGTPERIAALKDSWAAILKGTENACLLEAGVDMDGVCDL